MVDLNFHPLPLKMCSNFAIHIYSLEMVKTSLSCIITKSNVGVDFDVLHNVQLGGEYQNPLMSCFYIYYYHY